MLADTPRSEAEVEALIDPQELQRWLESVQAWLLAHVFVLSTLAQVVAVAVAVAYGVARLLAPRLRGLLERVSATSPSRRYAEPVLRTVAPLSLALLWLALQWTSMLAAANARWPHHVLTAVVSLLAAWVVIRVVTRLVGDTPWSRFIAVCAWSVAALSILDLLDAAVRVLDGMAIDLGEARVSMLGVVKAVAVLVVLLWMANAASRLLERRIQATPALTPSARVLFGKLFKSALIALSIIVTIEAIGIDLTTLAVFGGAVGLGLGFGLQRVVSNLVSGVILLLDRSVKPGDVITIGDTFGWINSLGARYVSVITRDGTEHLISNEELISQRVENWSYSSDLVRIKLPFGISYDSDVKKAIALALKAVDGVERVLKEPRPVCHLIGFGESSVELELRVWIRDPQQGVANVRSQILLRIWELYNDNDVRFPFPQRDLHLKSAVPLTVETGTG